jgi:hypothetical protein
VSTTVTVGLLSVEIFDGKVNAVVTIGGRQPISIDVGAAAGRRIFDELTKIREALLAADAVLHDDQAPSGPVTRSEVHLARLLVDLEIAS